MLDTVEPLEGDCLFVIVQYGRRFDYVVFWVGEAECTLWELEVSTGMLFMVFVLRTIFN